MHALGRQGPPLDPQVGTAAPPYSTADRPRPRIAKLLILDVTLRERAGTALGSDFKPHSLKYHMDGCPWLPASHNSRHLHGIPSSPHTFFFLTLMSILHGGVSVPLVLLGLRRLQRATRLAHSRSEVKCEFAPCMTRLFLLAFIRCVAKSSSWPTGGLSPCCCSRTWLACWLTLVQTTLPPSPAFLSLQLPVRGYEMSKGSESTSRHLGLYPRK